MNRYLRIVDNNIDRAEPNDDVFVICPKLFYEQMSEDEFASMQQLYKLAYEKARLRTEERHSGFMNGDGI